MLSISDTGVGMDADTQLHTFEPFFTTKGFGGTGLGLSTVYGIIQQSGGTVQVWSEPSKGTTFKIYFPRVDSTREAVGPEPAVVTARAEQALETILLVEDETSPAHVDSPIPAKPRLYSARSGPRYCGSSNLRHASRSHSPALDRRHQARHKRPGTGSPDL